MADTTEHELRNKTVEVDVMRILEINRYSNGKGGEIDLCNKEGSLLAIRQYEKGSPVEKVVELLVQLLVTGVYVNDN
jgi:hypothetical protein